MIRAKLYALLAHGELSFYPFIYLDDLFYILYVHIQSPLYNLGARIEKLPLVTLSTNLLR